jgi:hypothetical protein
VAYAQLNATTLEDQARSGTDIAAPLGAAE